MKAAVILSGCGVFDGGEIHETVSVYLSLAQEGCLYESFAPDQEQRKVISHLSKQPAVQKRNVLEEAARVARGNITSLENLVVRDYDLLIFPGGFGVACELSDFAEQGEHCTVLPLVASLVLEFHQQKKPIIGICIAPAILARIFHRRMQVKMTLGKDKNHADILKNWGMIPIFAEAHEVVVDQGIYTTPGYMDDPPIDQVYTGIQKAIKAALR